MYVARSKKHCLVWAQRSKKHCNDLGPKVKKPLSGFSIEESDSIGSFLKLFEVDVF